MDPPFLIRPAILADYAPLCALWEALDEHHRRVRPDLFRAPEGPRRELAWVQSLIDNPDSDILVAQCAPARLSGLAVVQLETPEEIRFRIQRPFVQVDNLVVAAADRRRGIGAALIRACADWSRARGIEVVELKMLEFNQGARRFYEAMGFVTARRWMSLELDRPASASLGAEESTC